MRKFTTVDLVSQKPDTETFHRLPRTPVSFVLDNVRSLQNVGLVFRLADALRLEKLYLTGITGHPPMEAENIREGIKEHALRQITKTAIHTVNYVPWVYEPDTVKLLRLFKSLNYQVVVAEQTDESKDFRKIKYKTPVVVIFGHERLGVSDEVLGLADEVAHIPMLGMGNSHNVAVSAAIISYEVLRKFV